MVVVGDHMLMLWKLYSLHNEIKTSIVLQTKIIFVPCVTVINYINSRWRHQMETFSALLAICAGNLPATGEFPSQRPVTRCFGVFFDLCLNKRLSKQSWDWWFETALRPLWRHCNTKLFITVLYFAMWSRVVLAWSEPNYRKSITKLMIKNTINNR